MANVSVTRGVVSNHCQPSDSTRRGRSWVKRWWLSGPFVHSSWLPQRKSLGPVVVKRERQASRSSPSATAGVSLEVAEGTFLAVMGASGSGKSTLLHLMAGLTKPDGGAVLVRGENLATMNDRQLTLFRRRHIGLVFQSFNLIPTLTAEE